MTDTRLLTAVLATLDGRGFAPQAFPALLSAVELVAAVLAVGRDDRLTERGCNDYYGQLLTRALEDAARDAKALRGLKAAA